MDVNQLLQQTFGFSEFRDGQRAVMSALWRTKAALAVFPTGGGKSLCYQLPALMLDGVTIVVSPLIALMKDQIDFLRSRGVSAGRLDSSLTPEEAMAVQDGLRDGTLKLLYVAPERFNNERFLAQIRGLKIALFAVDEAHCISEWGHNFRPDYLKLAGYARELGAERVLALTATATPAVVRDICKGFGIADDCAVVTGFYRPNLQLLHTPVQARERDDVLLARLRERAPGPTIVYVMLQKTAERVAARLADAGLPARPYHAGMDSENRTAVQEWWMAEPAGIVVATIAFGMGIDKANVRAIYHYNLPKGLESYCQEIGRAGRDGQPAVVELLTCADDVPTLENFAYGDTPTPEALGGLVRHVLSQGREFAVAYRELADQFDLRELVLRTALTYLELAGVLKQGTPFYAGYDVRPNVPMGDLLGQFPGEPGAFLQRIFAAAKHGRIWYGVNPDEMAARLGQERRRVVRAIEVLEERNLATIKVVDVRHRFTRLRDDADAVELAAMLVERFTKREAQEIARVARMLELATTDGCRANALAAYFGEVRATPCGLCSHCRTGGPLALPPTPALPPLPAGIDPAALAWLRQEHPRALDAPRQVARFLCGLTSPALSKARLGRDPLFGALAEHRFADVMAWVERGAR